jgi:hypothetical protein
MTNKLPPGEHKARVTGVHVGEDRITTTIVLESGEKVASVGIFSPDISDLTAIETWSFASLRAQVAAGLVWDKYEHHEEVVLGNFDGGDGVRFTLQFMMTCYRRGPYKLFIEIANGPGHEKWGCFDDADQPMRYYHFETNAKSEAQALACILVADRCSR